jgi:2-polyprenyl-6-hydroxyphenyl methylase/3-demethylubiquinone-9 3-methyltransferase
MSRRRPRLQTTDVRSQADVVAHFDRAASGYREGHGSAGDLLAYRLAVIRRLLHGADRGVLLELGCGPGMHLLALAEEFDVAIGTDLSPEMIRVATDRAAASPWRERVSMRVDPAETLSTVADESVDAALCVGALEHMLDRPAVLEQVRRVLRPGGRLACLTPHGGHWWYRHAAPLIRRDTRHLSTDTRLTPSELAAMAAAAGLDVVSMGWWRFVPRGDMPRGAAALFDVGERLGARVGVGWLRGGIALAAGSPARNDGAAELASPLTRGCGRTDARGARVAGASR